jgi:lipopolysaccharide/colanic/teichoic acid biosynthesis glycosyltransferase
MAIQGIICDFRLRRGDDESPYSLLTTPLGAGRLIDPLLTALSGAGCDEILIVPAFQPCDTYLQWIESAAGDTPLSVVGPDDRGDALLNGESSDSLVFLDPRYWPEDGFDLRELMAAHEEYFGPVFAVRLAPGAEDRAEKVVMDSSGNVRKIERSFDRTLWSHTDATVSPFCVIPHSLSNQGPTFPLTRMRRQLASHGVPIRDVPSQGRTLDLSRSETLLTFCLKRASTPTAGDLEVVSPRADQPNAMVSSDATVADSARLVGDVMVLPDAHVDAGALVIGPSVIGRGATIGPRATVAHSIVLDRAVAPGGSEIHHRLYDGRRGEDAPADWDGAFDPATTHSDDYAVVGSKVRACDVRQRRSLRSARIKRAMDVVVSAVGLVLLSPVLLVTAALVKLSSPGPLFFVHRREGLGGREFGCVKFRTMRTDAHAMQRELAEQNEADGPQFVIRKDPRVTPLGRILRKTNIDELPQLYNVLMGEMSLVGPRPSPFRENQVCVPWRRARLSAPPGITGLWQVCRYARDEGDFHQWIYFDTAYVRHMSPWLDLKIIFYTFVTLGGRRPVAVERVLGRRMSLDGAPAAAGV